MQEHQLSVVYVRRLSFKHVLTTRRLKSNNLLRYRTANIENENENYNYFIKMSQSTGVAIHCLGALIQFVLAKFVS